MLHNIFFFFFFSGVLAQAKNTCYERFRPSFTIDTQRQPTNFKRSRPANRLDFSSYILTGVQQKSQTSIKFEHSNRSHYE